MRVRSHRSRARRRGSAPDLGVDELSWETRSGSFAARRTRPARADARRGARRADRPPLHDTYGMAARTPSRRGRSSASRRSTPRRGGSGLSYAAGARATREEDLVYALRATARDLRFGRARRRAGSGGPGGSAGDAGRTHDFPRCPWRWRAQEEREAAAKTATLRGEVRLRK